MQNFTEAFEALLPLIEMAFFRFVRVSRLRRVN